MKTVAVFLCLIVLNFCSCSTRIYIKRPKPVIELHVHIPIYIINYPSLIPPNNLEHKDRVSSRFLSDIFYRKLTNLIYPPAFTHSQVTAVRDDFNPSVLGPTPTLSVAPTRSNTPTPRSRPPLLTSRKLARPKPSDSNSDSDSSEDEFDPERHPNWSKVNDEHCGLTTENRIVGGVNATLGQYPWMTRIGYRNLTDKSITHKCGGVLISHKFVVTAAHCVVNLPLELKISQIRLGEHDTSKDIDCFEDLCAPRPKDFDIDFYIVHQNYGVPLSAHDIALLQLHDSVPFNNWISPICLPFGSLLTKNLTGSKVDIAGWGLYQSVSSNESVVLQTVKLPVIDANICVKKFRRYKVDQSRQLCVGGEVGKDSCSGDSGGPLMKVEVEGDEGPRFYLFGIVSFGATYCGLNTTPAVYSRVVHYLKWILNNMND